MLMHLEDPLADTDVDIDFEVDVGFDVGVDSTWTTKTSASLSRRDTTGFI